MKNEKIIQVISELIITKLKADNELLNLQDVYGICISIADTDTVFNYQSETMNTNTIAGYLQKERPADEVEYFNSTKWTGFKYNVGDWFITDYELYDEDTQEFFDNVSSANDGDFDDLTIPRSEFPEDIEGKASFFLVDIIADSINLVKDKLDFINKTDDFVIFVIREGEWDYETNLKNMSKTISPELFNSKL